MSDGRVPRACLCAPEGASSVCAAPVAAGRARFDGDSAAGCMPEAAGLRPWPLLNRNGDVEAGPSTPRHRIIQRRMKPMHRPIMALAVAAALTISACAGGQGRQRRASHASIRVLPCREAIGNEAPERGMTVALGVVGLPARPRTRRALQTAFTGSHDPAARLFAKWGLVIRAGTDFQLVVPRQLRGRASIGWGNADEGHVGDTIVVHGCRGRQRGEWLDFAGGYWVRSPICLPLTVAADGRRRQLSIGIGKGCPGQLPPPQPTQS